MSHWVIPGLFGPLPRGSDLESLPRFAQLGRILGCADQRKGPPTAIEALADMFGIGGHLERPLATGPLSYLGETGEEPEQWMCLAHPVVLQPDQDRLLLFQPEASALNKHGLHELIECFNDHFDAEGLHLQSPFGAHCYLSAKGRHAVAFSDLEDVLGRNIDPFLPNGPDEGYWRGLLNETQMLLHGLSLNETRVARGLPPISGLWFSGGGQLPSALQPRVQYAAGTGSVLTGLCRLTGVALCDLDRAIAHNGLILADGPLVALIAADLPRWLTELQRLEAIFAGLRASSLTIDSCDGRTFYYEPGWRNLWRRGSSLRSTLR